MVTINELAEEIHKNAVDHGWWDEERNFGEIIALVHTELSEAFEEYRNGRGMDEIYFVDGKPEGIPIELMDAVIRILDVCKRYGIDTEDAIETKMRYNKTRPFRHGNKKA